MGHKTFLTAFILTGILARPAAAGLETAAASASTALRALSMGSFKSLIASETRIGTSSEEYELIRLLDDPAPEIRAQAARALKHYAQTSWGAESALLRALDKSSEAGSVRREAAKSLSWAAHNQGTRSRLDSLLHNTRESDDLRAVAAKALYHQASNDYSTRASLTGVLGDKRAPVAVRAGAAWGLWASANDYSTRNYLGNEASDRSEEAALRVEAIKSLYTAMSDYSTRRAVESLAEDKNAPEAVREAAILALHAANNDWSVQNYLERTARGEASVALRTAAIKAMQKGITIELARYFHLSHVNGRFLDPLEDQ